MRILHLSSESTWRGGEQQIAYLVEKLETKGIQPLVACKPGSEFEKFCIARDWAFHPLPMRHSGDIRSGLALKKLCETLSVDIVHAHSSHSHSTAFLAYLLGNRTPVVLTRRVDFELKRNFFSRYKYTFPGIRKIACVSNAIREIVTSGTGRPDLCSTIYSAINHKRFEPHIGNNFLRTKYQLKKNLTLIGNTSALAPHKDYATFMETAAHYVQKFDRFVRFFIIGSGELESDLKARVKALNLSDYFIFTGFLDNIEEVLPSLDIFLITSKTEGLGTSVIDSFAAKVPVVATQAGGIPELVQHRKTGLSSSIGNAAELADHLRALITDPNLKSAITENAYNYSLQFNTDSMALSYLSLYEEVLSGK